MAATMATPGDPSSTFESPSSPRQNDLPPAPPTTARNGDIDPAYKESIQRVLSSDIGVNTLLTRLKQSISSAKDFAAFLRERAVLEEKHGNGLRRLAQSSHNSIVRPESRQGSFSHGYSEIAKAHERIADHGLTFSNTLYSMADDLLELAANSEKGRKQWKQTGLNAEKRVQDAQFAMEKAKAKYNSLAEQYDRARTGERAGGKFGLKKSAAQEEENLHRKLEAADGDYSFKVQTAQTLQQELFSTHRPQTVNSLQELILETDAGLSVQIQRFAAQSEKLLLGYGLSITPLKGQNPTGGAPTRSLRELASNINNDKDFADYVLSFSNKASTQANEIKYEPHPTLGSKQQSQNQYGQGSGQDPYGQSYGTTHNRQASSVAGYPQPPYEEPNYGYSNVSSPLSHYPPGTQGPGQNFGGPRPPPPQQQQIPRQGSTDFSSTQPSALGQSTSGPPQLPRLESLGSDRFGGQTSGVITSAGPPPSASHESGQGDHFGQHQPSDNNPSGFSGPSQGHFGAGGPPRQGSLAGSVGPPPQGNLRQPSSNEGQPFGAGSGPAARANGGALGSQGVSGIVPGPNGPPQEIGRGAGPPGAGGGLPLGAGRGGPSFMDEAPGPGSGPRAGPPGPSGAGRGNAAVPFLHGQSLPSTDSGSRFQGGPGPQNPAARPPAGPAGGSGRGPQASKSALPPLKPVFGVSLDTLFQREGSAVPTIVYQCIQAVDLYGLETEGIYRTSGSAHHIMEMRQQFDHDSALVDFRNASSFHNDIASVTTLLKHFLRDLPEPLLTTDQYQAYIQAAKLEDDIVRRDSIHALVNALPDPNYATLRVLSLHLHRIAQRSDKNKMTISNLSIVFAPTLMGQQGSTNGQSNGMSADIADAGWQAKVVETILTNTLQIFDDDE